MKDKFNKWLMFNPKGQKFNLWYKTNKKKIIGIGIGTIVFFIVGVICFLIGGYIAGWDILGWFSSSQALAVYAIILVAIPCLTWFIWQMQHNTKE